MPTALCSWSTSSQPAKALPLLIQEELAERRHLEKQQRQRLKQKSQGKEQGAALGTAGAGGEPSGEERSVLSTPSLPDLDAR